jgi:hypothetical protein
MLKQSGMDTKPSKHKSNQNSRYPSQYDDHSIQSDVNEKDIQAYLQRAATNNQKAQQIYSCTNNVMCDVDTAVEDCPQNTCYYQYLDPQYDNMLDLRDFDTNKRVFYNSMKEIISTKAVGYEEDVKLNPEKNRLDELLLDKSIPCDYNKSERQAQLEDLRKSQQSQGVCNGSNPNGCDRNITMMDCPNRECYKKYLTDLNLPVPAKSSGMDEKYGVLRAKQQETQPASDDYKKKYNTLVVNSDVMVPDFIDVLVVMSETPIKIMLPQLQGPKIESTVGKVSSTSNLLIKNLSLCAHQIVTKGNNKIDTVRTSVSVEPAGKKMLGAVHDTWILM